MRRNLFITMLVAIAMTIGLLAPAQAAKPAPEPDSGPKKVWICHFSGHTAPAPWDITDATLDGDYVLNYQDGMPLDFQADYCADHGGKNLLLVSVNSLGGHGAQLLGRLDDYPDGYKG